MDADYSDSKDVKCEPTYGHQVGCIESSSNRGNLHRDCDVTGCSNTNEDNRTHILTENDVMQLEFDTHDEAFEWYTRYSKCVGFGVRKDDCGRDSKGEFTWRVFVCNKEGKRAPKHFNRVDRQREARPVTRTNCKASLRVKFDKVRNKWIVVKVNLQHNHKLAPPEHVHLIRCHRSLNEADIAQVDSMHSYGVKTAHIMGFMWGQSGGPTGVGFCRKDLYNHFDKQRRSLIVEGDAYAALSYLQAKANGDPMMFVKYTTDSEDRLENLFWCDGVSRADYEVFGDVLAFDTTYRKNKYNKPLVIFSGVNHHNLTVVFACALLVDETVDTYKWVLETLLEAMSNKKPNSVVTDGDKAMRKAIKELLPESTHRLCAWHLQRNAKANIKSDGFCEDMSKCLYGDLNTEEWEKEWEHLVDKYNVRGHKWVAKMYRRRAMWAAAWLRGQFFAGIRTTSMCEGINSFIKQYVESRHSLTEFLHHFERALAHYRNNELEADFASSYGDPVTDSSLRFIENSAAMLYTREIFKRFKKQLNKAAAMIVTSIDLFHTIVIYSLTMYRQPHRRWTVHCDRDAKLLRCSCAYFETFGIPCCHIICVMKNEHMESLPPSLIQRRWTKNAKSSCLNPCEGSVEGGDRLTRLRYATLVAGANRLCYLASKDDASFKEAREHICNLSSKLEGRIALGSTSSHMQQGLHDSVEDPVKVKTKGGPKKSTKRQRCTICKSTGHNKRRCPEALGRFNEDGDVASSESEDFNGSAPDTHHDEVFASQSTCQPYRPTLDDINQDNCPGPTQESKVMESLYGDWFD